MADSKRQRIVDAIKTRMATILTANGYDTDLGLNVREWESWVQQEDIPDDGVISICDLPAVAASSDQARAERVVTGVTVWLMPVQFRIFLKRDAAVHANLRTAIKDVNRAIRQDRRWTVANIGLAAATRPQREGPLLNEETFEIAGAVVEVEVKYLTKEFDSEE